MGMRAEPVGGRRERDAGARRRLFEEARNRLPAKDVAPCVGLRLHAGGELEQLLELAAPEIRHPPEVTDPGGYGRHEITTSGLARITIGAMTSAIVGCPSSSSS